MPITSLLVVAYFIQVGLSRAGLAVSSSQYSQQQYVNVLETGVWRLLVYMLVYHQMLSRAIYERIFFI